jgi:hypothetical protein
MKYPTVLSQYLVLTAEPLRRELKAVPGERTSHPLPPQPFLVDYMREKLRRWREGRGSGVVVSFTYHLTPINTPAGLRHGTLSPQR